MSSLGIVERELIASRLLRLALDQVHQNHKEIPEIRATYFWQPGRGGGALIVGEDGSVLFAHSSIDFTTHVEAFHRGRRTDLRTLE